METALSEIHTAHDSLKGPDVEDFVLFQVIHSTPRIIRMSHLILKTEQLPLGRPCIYNSVIIAIWAELHRQWQR